VRDRGGAPLPAVASLGTNPTFVEGGGLVLEVHVLDFDADLYGERVRVEFVARLRDEARYDSVAALLAQIDRDIADARARLSGSR
jgi:riboflavin kinase/FMN adenylyltransferase